MEAIISAVGLFLGQIGPSLSASGILALLAQVAPSLATGTVGTAIKIIGTILPPAVELAQNEIPIIKSIIATLKGNSSITKSQMDELDALDARCDALLDAALDKADADDAAADRLPGT
jgi:hypothetical protein